jgi:hypothetical protein
VKAGFSAGSTKSMTFGITIQERYLEAFSAELIRRCNTERDLRDFRDPFFVVSGHDLKLLTKESTFEKCRDAFRARLKQCFNWDDYMVNFPPRDCWLDLGFEDTPDSSVEAVTLLRKRHCTANWMDQFTSPRRPKVGGARKSQHLKKDMYPWSNTFDAVSGSVEMTKGGSFHPYAAYNKAYNLHKDTTAVALKNFVPFSNKILNGLVYDQEMLQI